MCTVEILDCDSCREYFFMQTFLLLARLWLSRDEKNV